MSFIYSKLEVEKRGKGEGIEREVRERKKESGGNFWKRVENMMTML